MEVKPGTYRVAIFNAYEVHGKNAGDEWVRVDQESSPRLHDTINEFLFEHSVVPVNISAPSVLLVHADDQRRVFRMGVSVIYTHNDFEQPIVPKSKEELLRDVANAVQQLGVEELGKELDELSRSADGAWFRTGVAKFANAAGSSRQPGEQS